MEEAEGALPPPASSSSVDVLLKEIEQLKLANAQLKQQVAHLLSNQAPLPCNPPPIDAHPLQPSSDTLADAKRDPTDPEIPSSCRWVPGSSHTLTPTMIHRYSRQLLVPSFGVQGQQNLMKSSVLIVGAGGLGSPAAMYLAACGIGCLGIVDHDVVELNNLHRQVIHTEANVGQPKVKSASVVCHAINSFLKVVEHIDILKAANALAIINNYDVVVDATDNVPTRYLINDACVVLGKPLVSGAALGMDGQLTVYNYKGGPCYRCLFPIPPPQGACQRCSDSGVLGVVPGIIGCLQALEAIKIASGIGEPLSSRMLLFDALSTRIHTVKLRYKNPGCVVCGDNPQIKKENLSDFNYESFTESPLSDESPDGLKLIPSSERISSRNYSQYLNEGRHHILLDVRESHQYSISALPNSINIPFLDLKDHLDEIQTMAQKQPIIVVCRRGNDSQRAVKYLRSMGLSDTVDIIGGLEAWSKDVDSSFPIY